MNYILVMSVCNFCNRNPTSTELTNGTYVNTDMWQYENETFTPTDKFVGFSVYSNLCDSCVNLLLREKKLRFSRFDFDGRIEDLVSLHPKIKDLVSQISISNRHQESIIYNYIYNNIDSIETLTGEDLKSNTSKRI